MLTEQRGKSPTDPQGSITGMQKGTNFRERWGGITAVGDTGDVFNSIPGSVLQGGLQWKGAGAPPLPGSQPHVGLCGLIPTLLLSFPAVA